MLNFLLSRKECKFSINKYLILLSEKNTDDHLNQSGSGAASSEKPQYGGGLEITDGLIDAITSRLVQKHPSFRPVDPNWRFYEASQPTQTSEVIPERTTPQPAFGVNLFQNDHNDSFDCKVLLKTIPTLYRQKASLLLNTFERQPNDLTFDSNGTVYIENEPLPNSNIQKIFPALFKKRTRSIEGLPEVIAKLNQMNQLHLTA